MEIKTNSQYQSWVNWKLLRLIGRFDKIWLDFIKLLWFYFTVANYSSQMNKVTENSSFDIEFKFKSPKLKLKHDIEGSIEIAMKGSIKLFT